MLLESLNLNSGESRPAGRLLFDNRQDVGLGRISTFLTIQLSVFHAVTSLKITLSPTLTANGLTSPLSVIRPGPHGQNFTTGGLLGRRIQSDDAASGFGFDFDALDDDAVVQWTNFHR